MWKGIAIYPQIKWVTTKNLLYKKITHLSYQQFDRMIGASAMEAASQFLTLGDVYPRGVQGRDRTSVADQGRPSCTRRVRKHQCSLVNPSWISLKTVFYNEINNKWKVVFKFKTGLVIFNNEYEWYIVIN